MHFPSFVLRTWVTLCPSEATWPLLDDAEQHLQRTLHLSVQQRHPDDAIWCSVFASAGWRPMSLTVSYVVPGRHKLQPDGSAIGTLVGAKGIFVEEVWTASQ